MKKISSKTATIGIGIILITILLVTMINISEERKNVYTEGIQAQQQEIDTLQRELKNKTSDALEKDIEIQEKNNIIQQLSAQNEGLTWQLTDPKDKSNE